MKRPETRHAETAHDILRREGHPLDVFFRPETVAVIGATETPGSVGRTVLWNLVTNPFGGIVFPVNPKRPSVLGLKAYPSVKEIPDKVDLAVIVTPAKAVPTVIEECTQVGCKAAIVISAGFKELGAEGLALEKQVLEKARAGGMRIIGPNCLGVMSPITGLNATFANGMATPGNVGFISQSGALCTAVLDWSIQEHVGFSAFLSIGSMADVGWGDLIDYLGDDPRTQSILIYMETVGDARSFISAAREVALTKPIIVIKAGRTAQAAKAAASHTGSLAGSDDVLDAALDRCGVLRVNTIADLFYMAEVLAKQPRPKGPNLTIVANAGGPGVLATDALILNGGKLTDISDATMEKLNEVLPPQWSHGNPVDVLGDADPDRYAKALEISAQDENSNGMLVILTPQDMTDPTQTAERLKNFSHTTGKPVLASWMGGPEVAAGEMILNKAGIPTFAYPDTAAKAFTYMWQYTYKLRGIYETPSLPPDFDNIPPDREKVQEIVNRARSQNRPYLTEYESKEVLKAYKIPTVETYLADTEQEAVESAEKIGYPVVLKLHSETITHKTDVGGVKLNLYTADEVRKAYNDIKTSVAEKEGAEHFLGVTVQPMIKLEGYEIILGSSVDPQFGPVLLFGMGGQLVEVFKDSALGLPPLNSTLARRMMEKTKIYTALKGVRGRKSVDMEMLEQLMVRFSQLVAEQKWIREIDINPLLASPEQLIALDARVVVYEKEKKEDELPNLSIRPYPLKYVEEWKLDENTTAIIRPIRPEDEPLIVKFHERLSERTVYLRFAQILSYSARVSHERLTRVCFIDYDREMHLVAEVKDPETGEPMIIGAARLRKANAVNESEFAVIIHDQFQGKGLGTEMVGRLVEVGKDEGVDRITADILTENYIMKRVCEKLGFKLYRDPDDPMYHAVLDLKVEAVPAQ